MLPVLLSEFKVQNPSTRFNLQQNDSTLLAQGLIDGTSDLCLGSTMITMKHIAWSYLYSEEIYITVPLHHRLADWEQATLKDIENEPFITMKPSSPMSIRKSFSKAMIQIRLQALSLPIWAFLSSRRFQEAMRSASARSTFPSRHAREKSASHGT